ncbi:MAG: radical SAM protein [Candidatus Hydrogenedentota bacterium]
MEDTYLLNSHKLHYHIERVYQWLIGKNVYPVYMEVGLTKACNHRCIFCAFDYTGFAGVFIRTDRLLEVISELSKLGVKSIMYAGEGEPLLHKDIAKIVQHTKKCGIDVSMETNGVLFNDEKIAGIIPYLEWIRVSLNAGTPQNYAKIHGTRKQDFYKILSNLEKMNEYKKKHKLKTTIGVQMILLQENMDEPVKLASVLSKIGIDYFSVKPYIKHPQSENKFRIDYNIEKILKMKKQLEKYETKNFKTILRSSCLLKLKQQRLYKICYGLPFFAEITSSGNVYTCGPYLYRDEFCYGNIHRNSFREIWESKKRKRILNYVLERLDVSKCMRSCRLDEINKYLWNLKNPIPHVNFI